LIKKLQKIKAKIKPPALVFWVLMLHWRLDVKKPFTAFAPQPFLPGQRLFLVELISWGQPQDFKLVFEKFTEILKFLTF
jgi:hypothetical protein